MPRPKSPCPVCGMMVGKNNIKRHQQVHRREAINKMPLKNLPIDNFSPTASPAFPSLLTEVTPPTPAREMKLETIGGFPLSYVKCHHCKGIIIVDIDGASEVVHIDNLESLLQLLQNITTSKAETETDREMEAMDRAKY